MVSVLLGALFLPYVLLFGVFYLCLFLFLAGCIRSYLFITLKCVIASLPFCDTAIFFLSFVLLAIGIFIVASFSLMFPLISAMYIFFTCLFFICSLRFMCALSFFATIITPVVSLSSLCTIPRSYFSAYS